MMMKKRTKGLIAAAVVIAVLVLLLWIFQEPLGKWIDSLFTTANQTVYDF